MRKWFLDQIKDKKEKEDDVETNGGEIGEDATKRFDNIRAPGSRGKPTTSCSLRALKIIIIIKVHWA